MEIIAHRGASGEFPEHTLLAYAMAVEQGADGVECDVRLTADGHLVCIHDRTVDRTTDGAGAVCGLTLDRLRRLDAGAPGHPQPVLEFEELLDFALDHPRLGLFVETKPDPGRGTALERALADRLRARGLARDPRLRLMSFAAPSVAAIGRLLPGLDRIQLVDRPAGARSGLRRALARPTHLGVDLRGARRDPERTRRLPDLRYSWLARGDADVEFAAAAGVRWLATDFPDRARAVLRRGAPGARGRSSR